MDQGIAMRLMESCSLKFLADSCHATYDPSQAGLQIQSICTDTRALKPGCLFVALKGERFNGHDFIRTAIQDGAAALLIDEINHAVQEAICPRLKVDNTRSALGEIATAYRRQFDIPVIAIAGSNGKTTTKELVAAVLGQQFNTLKSAASFNNEIGVPLSILRMEHTHRAAVLEAGTNHPGELAPLIRMIQPTHGILTNIGNEHLEFFGDLQGVLHEEGYLAELLPRDGILFLNTAQECSRHLLQRAQTAHIVRIGGTAPGDWRLGAFHQDADGIEFEVQAPLPRFSGRYRIQLLGRHQMMNALFAVAVGAEMGLAPEQIRQGLLKCQAPALRMEKQERGGVTLLVDCYNANADSMLAALQTLVDYPCTGRRIAVLGDMAELGEQATRNHLVVGRAAGSLELDWLCTAGTHAQHLHREAASGAIELRRHFEDVEELTEYLIPRLESGDVVLVKASRTMKFERLVRAFQEGRPQGRPRESRPPITQPKGSPD